MKIKITVDRRTTYSSIIEMDEAKFKTLNSSLDSTDLKTRVKAREECNKLIDTRDWQDDQLESVEEFEEFKED